MFAQKLYCLTVIIRGYEGSAMIHGEDYLTTYTFNTNQAKHKFCRICGVQSFYVPRSNPDSIGIMPHCIDSPTIKELRFSEFDGRNWEEEMKRKSSKGTLRMLLKVPEPQLPGILNPTYYIRIFLTSLDIVESGIMELLELELGLGPVQ
ncbi:S-(hydroxymethyl)glutathione synthase [Cooperia oncophora]